MSNFVRATNDATTALNRQPLDATPQNEKFCGDRLKNAGDIRDRKSVLPETVGQSSPNFLVDATPNHAKLCGDRLKNAGDIRDRKFLLPEKVGQTTTLPHTSDQSDHNRPICDQKIDWYPDTHRYCLDSIQAISHHR